MFVLIILHLQVNPVKQIEEVKLALKGVMAVGVLGSALTQE